MTKLAAFLLGTLVSAMVLAVVLPDWRRARRRVRWLERWCMTTLGMYPSSPPTTSKLLGLIEREIPMSVPLEVCLEKLLAVAKKRGCAETIPLPPSKGLTRSASTLEKYLARKSIPFAELKRRVLVGKGGA